MALYIDACAMRQVGSLLDDEGEPPQLTCSDVVYLSALPVPEVPAISPQGQSLHSMRINFTPCTLQASLL